MGRPAKPRNRIAITCSFSIPPELSEQYMQVKLCNGLSSWIQSMLSNIEVDKTLLNQYALIKSLVDGCGLGIHLITNINNPILTHTNYELVIKGLGSNEDITVAVSVAIKTKMTLSCADILSKIHLLKNKLEENGFNVEGA